MRLCDVRHCFRVGRFPVDGTIWHACYKHHPTSPYSSPSVEQVHADFENAHREFLAISCAGLDTMISDEVDMPDGCFGFGPPRKRR